MKKQDVYQERKQQFLEIAKSLAEQFYKKNKDYGDSYFGLDKEGFKIDKKLDEIDFYLQTKRKFARLASFAYNKVFNDKNKNLVPDETEEDTIRDLAIYCVMELIKRRKNAKK
jgi:hypothetical protein